MDAQHTERALPRLRASCKRFFLLLLFILAIGAFLVNTPQWIGNWWIGIRVLGVIATLYQIRHYTKHHFKRNFELSHQERKFQQVPPERAKQLQQEIAADSLLSTIQAEVFARAVVKASELQKRVSEHYEPNQRTLHQEIKVDVHIPPAIMRDLKRRKLSEGTADKINEPTTLFWPVVVPPKGVLYDGLKVMGADGESLPTLSYGEYLRVAARVLHMLLAVTCGKPPSQLPPEVMDCEEAAFLGLLTRIDTRRPQDSASGRKNRRKRNSPGPATSDVDDKGQNLQQEAGGSIAPSRSGKALAARIRTLTTDATGASHDAMLLAAQFVKILATHYAVVAAIPIPESGRFAIRYERTLIPDLDLELQQDRGEAGRKGMHIRHRLRNFKAILESSLGTRPVNIKVSLDNAWRCQSYHVTVECPEGIYLSNQKFIPPSEAYEARQAAFAPMPPHIRFTKRYGQPYAHFYGRYMPEPVTRVLTDQDGKVLLDKQKHPQKDRENAPRLVLNFAEVPPGSLCKAALAAIASVFLVWVIGYGLGHGHSGSLDGTDAPAFLLAFPGVAASWLGFDSATQRLFEGTLTARLSLACTAVVSLAATALYLLHVAPLAAPTRSGHTGKQQAATFQFSVLGIHNWLWTALVLVALFNAWYLTYRWCINSWRFRTLTAQEVPGTTDMRLHEEYEEQVSTASVATQGRTLEPTSSTNVRPNSTSGGS